MVGHAIKIEEGIDSLKRMGWLGPAPPYVSLYTPDGDSLATSNNPTFEDEKEASILENTDRQKSTDLG